MQKAAAAESKGRYSNLGGSALDLPFSNGTDAFVLEKQVLLERPQEQAVICKPDGAVWHGHSGPHAGEACLA